MHFLCLIVEAYMIVCVVRVLFSWLPDMTGGNAWLMAIQNVSYAATEPVFATVRKAMPRIGDLPIDFSPIVVFIGLSLLRAVVCSI